ncbi:MAG: hypothetical protein JSV65_07940 [Armatimonadota bacterium]|nr:MAG: hypothetical protein JSV65_07940 [Armatimonadota bacterium]
MPANDEPTEANRASCSGCPIRDCPAQSDEDGTLLSGRRLGLAASGLFLAPIVLALVGAACFAAGSVGQLLGAAVGFGAGVTCAVIATKLLLRKPRDDGPPH